VSDGPTDVELSRALNALTTTLNDWKVDQAAEETLQRIVTGALAGEPRIRVRGTTGPAAALTDPTGSVVGRIHYANGRWSSERVSAPLSATYIPSAG
jgi:hypothetical protein